MHFYHTFHYMLKKPCKIKALIKISNIVGLILVYLNTNKTRIILKIKKKKNKEKKSFFFSMNTK
jgi:hypothetical protein